MAALVGNLTSVGNPFHWTVLFARQPDPDLEFTEEELDQTTATRATGPLPPHKKSGGSRPILWIFLLLLVGMAYLAVMKPEMLAAWLSPYLGEHTPQPTVAMQPKPVPPALVIPAPPETAPEPSTAPSPNDEVSAPAAQTSTPATTVAPTAPTAVLPPVAAKSATPAEPLPAPLFGEGQKVTVTANPNAPGGSILLYEDASGTKPGPLVRAGVAMTVLDGDLQPSGWMYWVRTDEETKGWVSEKRLRVKR